MNRIDTILNWIFRDVSPVLLKKAFVHDALYEQGDSYSLESLVRQRVIYGQFLPDINIQGGEFITVSLEGLTPIRTERCDIYRIPLSATHGRHIVSAVVTEEVGYAGDYQTLGTGIEGKLLHVLGSVKGLEASGTNRVFVGGPNTVMLMDDVRGLGTMLRCRIENDMELNNWGYAYLDILAEACVELTKMMIYVKLNDTMGETGATAGSTNQYLRTTLDSYQDSREKYLALLPRITKASILQDQELSNLFLSGLLN